MRKMKDSGIAWIGEIPEEWETTPLLSVFQERKCKNIGLKEKNVLSLSYGKIIKRNIENNAGLMPTSFETYNIVENMNIVLRLTDLQNDKTSLRTGIVTENGIITSAYTTLESKKVKDTRFFSFLLRSYDELKVLYNMGNGVRQNLKFTELSYLPLLFPPPSEQQRIADYLDAKCAEIDRSMELVRQGIDKLKEYKKSVITEAVTKGLDPDVPMKDSGVPWIGEIPEGWEVKKIKSFSSIKSGDAIRAEELIENGLYDVFGGNGKIGSCNMYNTEGNNLIIGRVGVLCGNVKKVIDKTFVSDNALIIKINKNEFNYIYFSLLAAKLGDLNTSNAQPLITATKINNVYIAIPPIPIQSAIAAYLDANCAEIDAIIAKKQELLDKLAAYKKSLIFECVTGKREIAA